MTDFSKYTDASLSALLFNPKSQDTIAKKQQVLDGVYTFHNLVPTSVLFVGFTPTILSCQAKKIAVTNISDTAMAYLTANNVKFTHIPVADLAGGKHRGEFDVVIALDEFFTFAKSDQHQQELVNTICNLATEFVISTLRDFKNQEYKEREFSSPTAIRNGSNTRLFMENHDWDLRDRTLWNTMVYEVDRSTNGLTTYGVFDRRTMYFKQLAKFSMDAGASDFLVHKNLMYKSLIKKNYEHVVSIRFE